VLVEQHGSAAGCAFEHFDVRASASIEIDYFSNSMPKAEADDDCRRVDHVPAD
jgi:hypothetical protein